MSAEVAPIRVLLVEDNPADARLLTELLKEVPGRSFTIHTERLLRDALSKPLDADVVLLDLSLPDAQSAETVERMLAEHPRVPVVVLTGLADEHMAQRAMNLGAQDYLVKAEITPPLVARTILYAIERKRAEEHAKLAHAAKRAQLLAEVSEVLVSSLDLNDLARKLVQALVPTMGDCALLDLVDGGHHVQRVACAASSPEVQAALDEARERAAFLEHKTPGWMAIASGRSILLPSYTAQDALASASDDGYARLMRCVAPQSLLAVPLCSREGTVGALTLVSSHAGRRYGPEEQLLAEDIARRAALSVENARLYQTAQRAIKARDEVVAVVSHDLRNPLNVLGLSLTRLRSTQLDAARRAELVARAERAQLRMTRMLDDLLDITRLEAGTLTLDPQRANCGALLGELVDSQRPLLEQKQLSLEVDLVPAGDIDIVVDRDRMAQVISNIVGNAVKFTPPGGRIHVQATKQDNYVRIAITDTGPGIAPENLSRVFDRFWQSQRHGGEGAGLGLAIVKGIVEAHGGTVSVTSRMGEGATFRVLLPIASAQLELTHCSSAPLSALPGSR